MAKIFITGSADGLGQLVARDLIAQGHEVVLHARNAERAQQAMASTPGASDVLLADVSTIAATTQLAEAANKLGRFDAVIHNAGIYQVPRNSITADGLPLLFAVNSLAPYILTCLMHRPARLVYMSSGMHLQASGDLSTLSAAGHYSRLTYSDTKYHDLILARAAARMWPGVYANAVDPGWVPTKMGGPGAPDSLEQGYQTQVWLATSSDKEALVSGCYFHHKKQQRHLPAPADIQEKFLAACQELTGVAFK
jgi:NAD(P)-dependent dehydrogenase (short-subunit alcohol dehydrogenase family)